MRYFAEECVQIAYSRGDCTPLRVFDVGSVNGQMRCTTIRCNNTTIGTARNRPTIISCVSRSPPHPQKRVYIIFQIKFRHLVYYVYREQCVELSLFDFFTAPKRSVLRTSDRRPSTDSGRQRFLMSSDHIPKCTTDSAPV